MPDHTTAPVWFVDNFLKEIFLNQAKSKKYNIEHINRTVSSASSTVLPSAFCSHCRKKFGTTSRPASCPKCFLLKHSTKCSPCPQATTIPSIHGANAEPPTPCSPSGAARPGHEQPLLSTHPTISEPQAASVTSNTSSMSIPTPFASSSLWSLPEPFTEATPRLPTPEPASTTTITSFNTQGCHTNTTRTSISGPNSTRAPQATPAPSATFDSTTSSTNLNNTPSTPRAVHPVPRVVQNPEADPQRQKRVKKNKQPVLALSPEAAEISFLKQELNNANTKITMLDTEIDDLSKTIKIQKLRLNIFEDAKNTKSSEKYFQEVQHNKNSRSSSPSPPSCSNATCCQQPPSCCSCRVTPRWCRCQTAIHRPDPDNSLVIEDLLSNVSRLSRDVETIKGSLNLNIEPSPPSCNAMSAPATTTLPAESRASPAACNPTFAMSQASPAMSKASPTASQPSPAVSQTSPAVSQTSPAVSQTSPPASQARPAASQASPAVSHTSLHVSQASTAASQPCPATCQGQPTPAVSKASTDMNQTPHSPVPEPEQVDISMQEAFRDTSISSMEEFIPSDDDMLNLNSNLPTIQLN